MQTLPRWEIVVRDDYQKRATFEFIDGAVWVRVRKIATRETVEEVWNLDVATDDTFCAPMMATHNCKGFSGLLSADKAGSDKYAALNRLTLRGLALSLQAFADDPPSLILFENVPRIQTRGRELLDTIAALLRSHGYAVAETVHDCGVIGGLAQHRRRFLMVARHTAKVEPFLYEPPARRVRGIGEVIGELPLPDDPRAGPMHRLPRLEWRTWVRLALIEAGKDWRCLRDLEVVDGYLRDLALVPLDTDWHSGVLGVRGWREAAGTVTGRSLPGNGAHSVADPRTPDHGAYQTYGVRRWTDASAVVTGEAAPGAGPYSVADPRGLSLGEHSGKMAVQEWARPSRTVTGSDRVGSGAQCISDPRGLHLGIHSGKMAVQAWDAAARTVTGVVDVQAGAQVIADPRALGDKSSTGDWATAGFYGVQRWTDVSAAVTAGAKHDTGRFSVADPRGLPAPNDRPNPTPIIVSLDGTRHRPMTTTELLALQGYPVWDVDGEPLVLDGRSDAAWRERIGNSVPVEAARAIGDEMARTLLLVKLGTRFALSDTDVWVRQIATAIATAGIGAAG